MLAVISPLISRGVIDNTVQDTIDLRLWCIDGQEPLHLRMQGNCLRDIAGCRVRFRNRAAHPEVKELPQPVTALRQGSARLCAGDITLSRRARERDNRALLSNYLSVEFFVDEAMRVLIETCDFSYDLSLPQWVCSMEEDAVQRLVNKEALRRHVAYNVAHYKAPVLAQMGEMPPCDWDARLNHAEACMSIYPTLREKYAGCVDGNVSIAYVMGLSHILQKEADTDEQDMPPAPAAEWEVLDFLPPEQAPFVQEAMQHPLFAETARMTQVVQRHLINAEERIRASKEVAAFLSGYAGLVSHILSTILLTREKTYSTGLAMERMRIICKRLRALPQLCQNLPDAPREAVVQAATRLFGRLKDFQETIPH